MNAPQQCYKCLGLQHWDNAYDKLMSDSNLESIRVAAEYSYVNDLTVIEWEWILYRNNGKIMKRVIRNGNIIEDEEYYVTQ
jgi:hypothetical protein